jgi:hypothetical protein
MSRNRRWGFGPAIAIGSLIATASLVVLVLTGIANLGAMDATSLVRDVDRPAATGKPG